MQILTMMSVPMQGRRIYAIVPEKPEVAIHRLRQDDPIWEKPSVHQHWVHVFDPSEYGLKMRNRIKFWVAN